MKSYSLCGRRDWVHNYWSCKLWIFDHSHERYTLCTRRERPKISLSHDGHCIRCTPHFTSYFIRLFSITEVSCTIFVWLFVWFQFLPSLYIHLKKMKTMTLIEFQCFPSFRWNFRIFTSITSTYDWSETNQWKIEWNVKVFWTFIKKSKENQIKCGRSWKLK